MAKLEFRKRTGRPAKAGKPGVRFSLGLKVTGDIKARIDQAARDSGRTQSQEAEYRLERSFDREDLLPQALKATFGSELAGILLMVGHAMKLAGRYELYQQAFDAPDRSVTAAAAMDGTEWLHNSLAATHAKEAADCILNKLLLPEDLSDADFTRIEQPWAIGKAMLDAVAGKSDKNNPFHTTVQGIPELLGPVVHKMKSERDSAHTLSRESRRRA